MRERELAESLWLRHRLSVPVNLRRLGAELGLQVVSFPFAGRVREVIVERTIGVRKDLPRPWFRWSHLQPSGCRRSGPPGHGGTVGWTPPTTAAPPPW